MNLLMISLTESIDDNGRLTGGELLLLNKREVSARLERYLPGG